MIQGEDFWPDRETDMDGEGKIAVDWLCDPLWPLRFCGEILLLFGWLKMPCGCSS